MRCVSDGDVFVPATRDDVERSVGCAPRASDATRRRRGVDSSISHALADLGAVDVHDGTIVGRHGDAITPMAVGFGDQKLLTRVGGDGTRLAAPGVSAGARDRREDRRSARLQEESIVEVWAQFSATEWLTSGTPR